jgi:hypothetical protein
MVRLQAVNAAWSYNRQLGTGPRTSLKATPQPRSMWPRTIFFHSVCDYPFDLEPLKIGSHLPEADMPTRFHLMRESCAF